MKNELKKALMNVSKIHPLYFAFIAESIARYSDQLLKDEAATLKAMEHSFINGETWLDIAKDMSAIVNVK